VAVAVVALVAGGVTVPLLWTGSGDSGPLAGATPTDGAASGSTGEAASPSPSPSTSAGPILIATAPPLAPSWGPLSIEAEAGMPAVKLRAADVVSLGGGSGGRGVQFGGGPATIEFRQLALPEAGAYRVTVFYSGGSNFTGTIRGSGDAVEVTYSPTSSCCATLTVWVALNVGGSLILDRPTGDGPRPIIDRVVIDQS
jgi:hypothetical protein